MKTVKLFAFCAILFAAAASLDAKLPQELKFEPLHFVPPRIEKRTLQNGMTLYLLPDHELPLIQISALIKTGSVYEPAEKTGLASLCGTLIRSGGTKFRKAEEIDDELEFLGASVETGIDQEAGSASCSVLKKDFGQGLKTFAEVLMFPRFDKKRLEIEKAKLIESIRRRNDDPFQIARREFRKLVYGRSHPLSRITEIPAVKKISRSDLMQFYEKYFHPNAVTLAVSGDFEVEEMAGQIESAFAGWKKMTVDYPAVPYLSSDELPSKKTESRARTVGFGKKNLNQTSILLGHLGVKRHNPDRFALEVANEILGGSSFTSRLYRDVRSRQGLAYWIGSSFSEPYDYGIMAAGCQTKSASTGQAIQSIFKVIRELREKEVGREELQLAKDAIVNSFVFRFASSHAVAAQKMSLDYYGFPEDYLDTYTNKISQVTAKDVLEAAQKYFYPDQAILCVVGNDKDFDIPLKEFGAVREIDLKIPE